jgi:site-specific DNA-adenine methylase
MREVPVAFGYFGAKHGLARRYPAPRFPHIIEPFAGAAGYACWWATPRMRVTLRDLDPLVIDTWTEILTDPGLLDRLTLELGANTYVTHFVLHNIKHPGMSGVTASGRSKTSSRTIKDWGHVASRIAHVQALAANWTATLGDYRDLPNVAATWFIDPPYRPTEPGVAGDRYMKGAAGLDYSELAAWCRSRRGQVIVCEQEPADWLPFRPLAAQTTQVNTPRNELVWTRTPNLPPLSVGGRPRHDYYPGYRTLVKELPGAVK